MATPHSPSTIVLGDLAYGISPWLFVSAMSVVVEFERNGFVRSTASWIMFLVTLFTIRARLYPAIRRRRSHWFGDFSKHLLYASVDAFALTLGDYRFFSNNLLELLKIVAFVYLYIKFYDAIGQPALFPQGVRPQVSRTRRTPTPSPVPAPAPAPTPAPQRPENEGRTGREPLQPPVQPEALPQVPSHVPTQIPTEVPAQEPTQIPTPAQIPAQTILPGQSRQERAAAVNRLEQAWLNMMNQRVRDNLARQDQPPAEQPAQQPAQQLAQQPVQPPVQPTQRTRPIPQVWDQGQPSIPAQTPSQTPSQYRGPINWNAPPANTIPQTGGQQQQQQPAQQTQTVPPQKNSDIQQTGGSFFNRLLK
ncbi:uncharacterized protein F4812DRAFT_381599 [Daldinia caldariorum]|uniref:uncharacterized protein n=1 Tax=Daldinia caldariorum TaxID=326644 RepID=UPI002007C04E|nr:uncharacterized protein F4812DRAFT_381599 [Daldinia caldariorum]KAI1467896.1 hypothetical protein F4812DRAFT_381599 [Daldinia caldariorum]